MERPVKFVHGDTWRACENCAKAKTKCITNDARQGASTSCDRCLLLKKTCVPRPENHRKRKRRTAQTVLAEKIDEVVALLKVSPAQGTPYADGQQMAIPERPAPTVTPSRYLCFPSLVDTHGLRVDIHEANDLLAHFREHQAAMAPYVEIPDAVTASQLRDDKPLLFLAVMTAASHHDARRQEAFSKASIALLADLVLIQGHKNLALLQGMILLLGYFHTQALINPQITNLLHLCMAMCVDLGLNQVPAPVPDLSRGPTLLDGPRRAYQVPGANVQRRTLEERRAYAGCFYLSNIVATSFIITVSTALPWTEQLDEACDVLSQTGLESDVRLARLVKLQHIVSQISELKKQILSAGPGPVAPLSVYLSPFESALTRLWEDTPEEVRQDTCLKLAYQTARMILYQISLPPTIPSSQPSPPPHVALPIPTAISIAQTRHLCLASALAGVETHLSVPPSKLYHFPLPFYAMTGHILTTLARLRSCASTTPPTPTGSATSDPSSDHLRFDLASVIERTASHLEQAAALASRGRTKDGFRNDRLSHWAAWLRRCARALGIVDGRQQELHQQGGSGGSAFPGGRPPDLRAFVAGMDPCRREVRVDPPGEDSSGGEGGGKDVDGIAFGGSAGAGGYITPSSGLDMGGVAEAEGDAGRVLLPQESDSFPAEWATALLEDISGYGLFGLSDDFLMQDTVAGCGTGSGSLGLPE